MVIPEILYLECDSTHYASTQVPTARFGINHILVSMHGNVCNLSNGSDGRFMSSDVMYVPAPVGDELTGIQFEYFGTLEKDRERTEEEFELGRCIFICP